MLPSSETPHSLSPTLAPLWNYLLRARRRFALSVLVSVAVMLALPYDRLRWIERLVAGWDAGALSMLSMTWWIIMRSGPRQSRRRAASQDPGRTLIWFIVLASCVFSLFGAAVLLGRTHHADHADKLLLVVLCLGAVAVSWLLTHTAYALRYAHLYYREDDEGEGGLCFPGNAPPDDWDFVYFAFTLGMCFQVSDVTITSRTIRRYALIHAVLSFAYNTAILALALNLAFSTFA